MRRASCATRVMSARSASASRSNCSLMCSSNDSGTPTGIAVLVGAAAVALAAICSRRSISRTSCGVLVEAQAIGRIEPDLEPRQAAQSASRGCSGRPAGARLAPRPCRRRRTCARTRAAGSAPSAAGSSASTTRCCSCRRSCSLRRSCSSSRRDLRRRTASTGAASPVRSSGRSAGRSSCRCRCRRPRSAWVCSRRGRPTPPSGRAGSGLPALPPSGREGRSESRSASGTARAARRSAAS